MIGLVDGDAYVSQKRWFLPNLQLMKLYSYYEKRGQIVRLIQYPEEYSQMDQIFLRQQFENSPVLDESFFQHQNLHLGGAHYSRSKYIPFKDLEIEAELPSQRLYYPLFKKKLNSHHFRWKKFLKGIFFRINSPAGLPYDYFSLRQNWFIYDEDLVRDKRIQLINTFKEYKPTSISFNHSLIVRNEEEYNSVRSLILPSKELFQRKTPILFSIDQGAAAFKKRLDQDMLQWIPHYGSLEIPLLLAKNEKIQYNIIQGVERIYHAVRAGVRPMVYYKTDYTNPYNQFCLALVAYSRYNEISRKDFQSFYKGMKMQTEYQQILRLTRVDKGFKSLLATQWR